MLDRGRVLVIGAGGQLGGEFCAALGSSGASVHAADRTPRQGWLAVDLSKQERLSCMVREMRPAVVVNAAAYTAVDRAESEPELAMAINGTAPGTLARVCREVGALMLHFSTDYVFDGRAGRAYTERDAVSPLNEYGRSKATGEQAICESGADYFIVRTSWLYTPGASNFVSTMLRLFREAKTVRVVDDQIGSPTCARQLAQVLTRLLMECDEEKLRALGGLYHLCADGETSWYGFARAIHARTQPQARALLQPIDTATYGAPAARPARSTLACTRAKDSLDVALPHWLAQLEAVMPEFNAAPGGNG